MSNVSLRQRVRDFFSRWTVADALNRSPRTCWADLVDWAMYKSEGDPYEDEDHALRNSVSGGSRCRVISTESLDKACYCGKFTNGCLTRKDQTPGDLS